MARGTSGAMWLALVLLALCCASPLVRAASCDADLLEKRWRQGHSAVLPDGFDTEVDFSFFTFANGTLRSDYSFSRHNCSATSVTFAPAYAFDNESNILSWNATTCFSSGDAGCAYCPIDSLRYLHITYWAASCKSFNATRLISSDPEATFDSNYVSVAPPDTGPHITKTAVVVMAVLGAVLAACMVLLLVWCLFRGSDARDRYDPIR